jgi:hypothetical protein
MADDSLPEMRPRTKGSRNRRDSPQGSANETIACAVRDRMSCHCRRHQRQVPDGLQPRFRAGHTKMDSTVRYLGVDLDDALTISEGIDL